MNLYIKVLNIKYNNMFIYKITFKIKIIIKRYLYL